MIIGGKYVDQNSPALIIAEAGINHDGNLEQALALIDMAAEAGADICKFQLFTAAKLYTIAAGNMRTANGTIVDSQQLLQPVELRPEWLEALMTRCKEKNIGFLCTVCDEQGADILEAAGVDSYKLTSTAMTHIPLHRYVARKGKPMVFSTGGGYIGDVDNVVRAIESEGNDQIVLMHCVTAYPTPLDACNLQILRTLQYNYPEYMVGFSDHSEHSTIAPVAAIAMGAKLIEKHITLDKTLPGADHCFAQELEGLKEMIAAVRETERKMAAGEPIDVDPRVLGTSSRKTLNKVEERSRSFAFRTIFTIKDMKKGDVITPENTAVLRPGNAPRGIDPVHYTMLVEKGVRVNKDIPANTSVKWDDVLNFGE